MASVRRTPDSFGAVKCAIYTRKSTSEGLDSDFNTLDAQREARMNERPAFGEMPEFDAAEFEAPDFKEMDENHGTFSKKNSKDKSGTRNPSRIST